MTIPADLTALLPTPWRIAFNGTIAFAVAANGKTVPWEAVEEALRQVSDSRAAPSPDGLVLVPKEPTTVQANAGVDADGLRTGFETVKHIRTAAAESSGHYAQCVARSVVRPRCA